MFRSRELAICAVLLFLLAPRAAQAAPFKYPEAKHGKGELKYVNGLPVLTVEGTPEEIGEQVGTLAVKPAAKFAHTLKEFVKQAGLEKAWPILVGAGNALFKSFPDAHRRELTAMAKASGTDAELLIIANTISDLQKIAGCSTLTIDPERSATGAPLFGRNFDFPPVGQIPEYGLLIVYRPAGKRAFATVTFPGLLMGGSAINDAGLAFGVNEVTEASDGSASFNRRGVPLLVGARRLVEECTTVDETEKFLRSVRSTSMFNLAVCDKKGGAVFEVTTKTVARRRADKGICSCTNHFRSKGLAVDTTCARFDALEKSRALPSVSLAEVGRKLHAANQGGYTLHTMIFEPTALRLHLSLGRGPSSARPLQVVDLAPLFRRGG